MKQTRTLKVKRMTTQVQKRLESFGFTIKWVRFSNGFTVVGYTK